ncbi:patatin-like phospholipase family protein [Chlorobium sp. N1]|uniref:patatin-like phospholipase family protein n=1 Tax=Chlorobium sp. N1 TaxID=2491138 RepID=UPI00103EB7E4|nr:patatin-like phospholipase family protein [Chlorobium sp. N1]TCD47876.1 patatin [Chlorobium sp. N1]
MINKSTTGTAGLALGGGAVLGAAHIGVLRALDELDIRVSMVSGTSIGSFIAALHAFGKSWREIRDVTLELDWLDLSGPVLSQYGILSNKKFGQVVHDLLGRRNIEDAPIRLAMVAADISTGRKAVLRSGDVAEGVMASSCIPGVFRPLERNGSMLVDGVLLENVPISPLVDEGLRPVICVDLLARHAFTKPESIVGLLLNSFYTAVTNTASMQTAGADLCLAPDLSAFNLVDTSQVSDLIDAGYRDALPALRRFMEKAPRSS